MGNVGLSILNDLTAFDSATVQNAAIRIRGYINESDDYTGTSLKGIQAKCQQLLVLPPLES